MKELTPNGNLLVLLFNGYGDAFLALPALREIARKFAGTRVYLVCFRDQIEPLFSDLPFEFIAGDRIEDQIILETDLRRLDFQQAVSFNAYYPSATDSALFDVYKDVSRWGFCDANGNACLSSFEYCLHMRDQYFAVLNWPRTYQLADRQVCIPESIEQRVRLLCKSLSEANGERFYALHLDSVPNKMWPTDSWAEVIFHAWSLWGAWPLIVGEQSKDASRLTELFPFAHKLNADCGISAHFAAVKQAKVFIGIDSIFAHVADSYQKSLTVLFGASDPALWGPRNPLAFTLQAESGNGMSGISSEKVIALMDSLFASFSSGQSLKSICPGG